MTPDDAPVRRPARLALAGLLGGAAVLHLVLPETFEAMVPRWLPGRRRLWNLGSAAAEGASAALLLTRRTQRLGGALAGVTFVVVFVANVQAVIDGGMYALPGRLATRRAAILRLPLQAPLVWWAWRIARSPAPTLSV